MARQATSAIPAFTVGGRFYLVITIAFFALLSLAIVGAARFSGALWSAKQQELVNITDSAASIVADFHQKALRGELSMEEAKARAADALRPIRYADDEYFFIHGYDAVTVMHPMVPAMEGTDQSGLRLPDGRSIILELADLARAGGGFFEYDWPLVPGGEEEALKVAYVVGFEPWEWTIGTGVLFHDVRDRDPPTGRNIFLCDRRLCRGYPCCGRQSCSPAGITRAPAAARGRGCQSPFAPRRAGITTIEVVSAARLGRAEDWAESVRSSRSAPSPKRDADARLAQETQAKETAREAPRQGCCAVERRVLPIFRRELSAASAAMQDYGEKGMHHTVIRPMPPLVRPPAQRADLGECCRPWLRRPNSSTRPLREIRPSMCGRNRLRSRHAVDHCVRPIQVGAQSRQRCPEDRRDRSSLINGIAARPTLAGAQTPPSEASPSGRGGVRGLPSSRRR